MGLDKQKDPEKKDIEFILNLLSKNKFMEAEDEINKLIINFPNSSILFNILGAVFAEQSEFEKAIKKYEKAIKIKPNYAEAHSNLGVALDKSNKISDAIKCYEKAISLKNNFA